MQSKLQNQQREKEKNSRSSRICFFSVLAITHASIVKENILQSSFIVTSKNTPAKKKMSLEILANELLFELFEYFSSVDLFRAFNGLNSRFNFLIIEYFRSHQHIDFRLIFKEDLNEIRRRYLPLFINEIKSVYLSDDDTNPHTVDFFISRLYPFHRFTNLRSLSFFNIYSMQKINRILDDLKHISQLNKLYFKQCFIHYDPRNVLILMNHVWSLPSLTHFSLDIDFGDICHLIPPRVISCSLRHLSMPTLQCDLDNFSLLYEHTPSIESLCVSIWDPYDEHYQLSLIPSLTTFKLKCQSSSRIIEALLRKTPNLINLTVETKIIHMDGHMWRNIINKNLPKLKIFNLKMEFELIDYDDIEQDIDRIIDSYRTKFWICQHQWLVRCFCYTENESSLVHLHTFPYVFEKFSIGINDSFLYKSTFFKDNSSLKYNYVQNLNYCVTTFEDVNLPKIEFPNVRQITLTLPYDDHFRFLIPRFNKLISLKLRMTNWAFNDNDLIQLQILIDQSPHLYYLKFHSWSTPISKNENKNKKVILFK